MVSIFYRSNREHTFIDNLHAISFEFEGGNCRSSKYILLNHRIKMDLFDGMEADCLILNNDS